MGRAVNTLTVIILKKKGLCEGGTVTMFMFHVTYYTIQVCGYGWSFYIVI